jgi:hypothetical protein
LNAFIKKINKLNPKKKKETLTQKEDYQKNKLTQKELHRTQVSDNNLHCCFLRHRRISVSLIIAASMFPSSPVFIAVSSITQWSYCDHKSLMRF